ncbi:hypothetical protein ABZX90_41545 [Streptomyces sp. NPDC002935]|uniref:hypothetical protein n=1 Tax=Streptomyces sp. NPDC002935 TaxID=3154545 RepID=UPI0033AF4730
MTITRLDYLAANGTNGMNQRIFMADGHGLSVKGKPGAVEFEEVYLAESLDAPDTDGWQQQDDMELWLTTGDQPDNGHLFYDVPVAVVRLLIDEHGGEDTGQDPIA